MRTLEKAFSILDIFSHARPSLRLADIAEATGIDRSTAHRMLRSMVDQGYLMHRRDSRRYELGPSLLRLALIREAVVSTRVHHDDLVRDLTEETQESSHVSLRAGLKLATIAAAQGRLANRVAHESGAQLDPHATASGLAYLAFADPQAQARCLSQPMTSYSAATPVDMTMLQARLDATRACGHAIADGTFDPEVFGIAAPIFGPDEYAVGAVAVATPFSRMTPELRARIAAATVTAALRATAIEGGRVPGHYHSIIRTLRA